MVWLGDRAQCQQVSISASNTELEEEQIEQSAEGELPDEALEAAAGGVCVWFNAL